MEYKGKCKGVKKRENYCVPWRNRLTASGFLAVLEVRMLGRAAAEVEADEAEAEVGAVVAKADPVAEEEEEGPTSSPTLPSSPSSPTSVMATCSISALSAGVGGGEKGAVGCAVVGGGVVDVAGAEGGVGDGTVGDTMEEEEEEREGIGSVTKSNKVVAVVGSGCCADNSRGGGDRSK